MPNINEFLNKNKVEQVHSTLEKLDGIRPCAQCKEDVDGGLWDSQNLIMQWTCSQGHKTIHQVG
jgi:hypothetical protein